MTSVYDVPADKLIGKLKEELKAMKEITPPEWAKFVKTSSSRERLPAMEARKTEDASQRDLERQAVR